MSTPQTEARDPGTERDAEASVESVPAEISADETFELLRNRRRRTALRALDEHGPELTHGELAEHVAAHEYDVPRGDVTSVQRKRVYISLYQNHLPRFAEAGVVAYDADRGDVELCPASEALFAHLDLLDGAADSPDRTTLLALLGVNALVVVGVLLPFAPAPLVVLVSIGLFAATAVYAG